MATKRFGRMQKATAIVPLALLSAAWTASLAGVSPAAPLAQTAAEGDETGLLPGGASVPGAAIEAPASVSSADEASSSFLGSETDAEQIVATSSTNGIPSSALAAYQRAETVINRADPTCKLSWQLIAAIGRVESNHGRFGGSALNTSGVATPAIFGPVLNGGAGTSVIRDTDNGANDGDKVFDRAMGPMQFIPSTWSVVQVDADNDGVRNPQDIDDAALATAVYLCSGDGDLSTLSGQKTAVYRYNHSSSYVDLVLSIMQNYLQGDYTSVPDSTRAAGYLTPLPIPPSSSGNGGGGTGPENEPTATADPAPAEVQPSEEPTQEPAPTDEPSEDPTTKPPVKVPPVKVPPTGVDPVDETVDGVLTLAQAIVQCTLDGLIDNPLSLTDKFDDCVTDYTTPDKPKKN